MADNSASTHGAAASNHRSAVGRVLPREVELFVGDVGVVGVLLAGEVEGVDDHVVVQHLCLVGAADGVELVLPLGLGVRAPLLAPPTPLGAEEE